VGLAAPPLSGSAAARKAPDASDKEKPVDEEKPVMTTILFAFGMIFLVPQLFLIGLWTMGKIGTYRLPFLGVAFGAAHRKPLRDRK
jgi:hypothetical protein